jgi:hypothetical protein
VQRIRKAQVCLVSSGEHVDAFVFDETDTDFEVLLTDDNHFEVLFFNRESTLTACGRFQLITETL